MTSPAPLLGACLTVLCLAGSAAAHIERPTTYPDPRQGRVPAVRTTGPSLVVCRPDSRSRVERTADGPLRRENLRLLRRCRYSNVQAAVEAARSGTRILLLPGVYTEEPSRRSPSTDARCAGLTTPGAGLPPSVVLLVPSYAHQRRCPNAQNLIAIVGDADGDGDCDDKCSIQIEGRGSRPSEVVIAGDRRKLNVIRADRADGIVLRNFTVQHADFNNVYVLETNGFRFERIVSRWSREYGFLSFTSDHGLYRKVVAYGAGDAGIYTGSGPEGHCNRYGIEIDQANVYGSLLGLSGTAANGIDVHDSRFHHNVSGLLLDSISPGHPGMPQDCARVRGNRIHSNNLNLYSPGRRDYCRRPVLERDPMVVCPALVFPIGTGIIIGGGNGNRVERNWIYDNWRYGVMLFWAPAVFRGEPDPARFYDTSHRNRFVGNRMSVRPGGRRDANGVDFWWDEEGRGNCWTGTRVSKGARVRSDPAQLPRCPGPATSRAPDSGKLRELAPCLGWTSLDGAAGLRCTWADRPRRPR